MGRVSGRLSLRWWHLGPGLAAVLLTTSLVLAARAGGTGVVLRFHRGEGDRATYKYSATAKTTVEVQQELTTATGTMSLQMVCLAQFQGSTPQGDVRVQGQILSGAMRVKAEGEEETLPLENVVVDYELSPQGGVRSMELVAGEPAMFPGLPIRFTPDEAFLLGLKMRFPDRALKAGERWRSAISVPGEEGETAHSIPVDSVLLGFQRLRGRPCAKIRSQVSHAVDESASAPDSPETLRAKGKLVGTYTWYFDYERGLILSSESTERLTLRVRSEGAGGGASTGSVSATMTTRSVLTDYNGQKLPDK